MEKRIQKVLQQLSAWDIPYTLYTHPPLPTVEVAMAYWKNIPEATHCKNLFFRNHKGNRHYLVILECSKQLNIRDLEQRLKQGKLTFASAERMEKNLGLSPGSVSPFGLINDTDHAVLLFIDKYLTEVPSLSFHPNDNTASAVISTSDFFKFLNLCGNQYELLDFDESRMVEAAAMP
jgi:Ala-tRNA(Pro) deacylase